MRLLVWGASPTAAWLAARFHHLGYETIWLTQEPIASTIQRFGLELISPHHRETYSNLTIETRPENAIKPPLAWIILAMPTWALNEAVMQLGARIPPTKCPDILLVQHGIGGVEKITTFFDESKILTAASTRTFTWPMLPDGQIAYETVVSDGLGGLALSHHPHALKMAHMLHVAGLGNAPIYERSSLQWSHLFWSIQANALAAILDLDPHTIYQNPELFEIEYRQLREAVSVIDRENVALVELPGVNVPRLAWQVRLIPKRLLAPILQANTKPPSLKTELHQQWKRSDAAYLNGMVAKAAHDYGIAAPTNQALAISVTDIAEGRALWSQFKGNLDYLQTIIRVTSRHVR